MADQQPVPTPDDAVASHAERRAREGDERYADYGGPVAAKLRAELADVRKELEGLNAERARMRAAADAGLPLAHASRLKGETADELASDARELAKALGAPAGGQAKRPEPKDGISPGTPLSGAIALDPAKLAAAIARRMHTN